jgi:hypothetical protein
MVKIATLVALVAPLVAAAPQDIGIPNIVGGTEASAGDFPFIVSISYNGNPHCGGTLLNANTVLTAAHCTQGRSASAFAVRAGTLVSSQLLPQCLAFLTPIISLALLVVSPLVFPASRPTLPSVEAPLIAMLPS